MNAPATLDVRPGMTVRVHEKIKDVTAKGEERERLQAFEGVVLARTGGNSANAAIVVRRIASGVGVEKIFPLHSPIVTKIDVIKRAQVRRAKLYYLRGNPKNIKEAKIK